MSTMRRGIITVTIAAGMLAPICLLAQESYTLQGTLTQMKAPAKIYLTWGGMKNAQRDSALLQDGRFSFKGTIAGPVKASLVLDHGTVPERGRKDYLEFYLEPGNSTLTATDSIRKAVITGSPVNKSYQAFKEAERSLMKNYADSTEAARMQASVASTHQFIKAYPNSVVSLEAVGQYLFPIPQDAGIVEGLFNQLTPELKATGKGKEMAAAIQELKKTAIGVMAPDFVQTSLDEKPVKLSDFRGKYVLVDFWASWCHPCRNENPGLLKAYNAFRDKNFTLLGVSLDRNKAAWQKAVKDDGLPWTQVADLASKENAAANLYSIQAIPQNFLIDPQGKIIAKNLKGEQLERKLKEVL